MMPADYLPWPEAPDLSNYDLDNIPVSWDVIASYVLVTLNAMASLVIVLGALGWYLGTL